MGDENQTGSDPQYEDRRVSAPSIHAVDLLGPITLFVSVYLATFLAVGYGAAAIALPYPQWAAFIAVIFPTAFVVRIVERGRWRLGIFLPPRVAGALAALGILFPAML